MGPKWGFFFYKVVGVLTPELELMFICIDWRSCGAGFPKANTPEKARIELQEWLPKDYWTDINPLVVGFGQVICVPRAANCDICTLARDGLCKGVNKKLLKPRCLKNGLTSCRNKELISLNYLRSLCKQNLKHLNS